MLPLNSGVINNCTVYFMCLYVITITDYVFYPFFLFTSSFFFIQTRANLNLTTFTNWNEWTSVPFAVASFLWVQQGVAIRQCCRWQRHRDSSQGACRDALWEWEWCPSQNRKRNCRGSDSGPAQPRPGRAQPETSTALPSWAEPVCASVPWAKADGPGPCWCDQGAVDAGVRPPTPAAIKGLRQPAETEPNAETPGTYSDDAPQPETQIHLSVNLSYYLSLWLTVEHVHTMMTM